MRVLAPVHALCVCVCVCAHHQILDKLELVDFRSVTDDPTRDSNLDKARFNVHLKERSFKFTVRVQLTYDIHLN